MLTKQLDQALATISETLQQTVSSDVEILYDASHHLLEGSGKMIRPRVTLLAYLAAGGRELSAAVPLAAAVELVHTATLVHDDINDHSEFRRGRPTVHSKWDRTFALLTGDYLFAKVYQIMAPFGPEFNTVMADACVRLVEGETLQARAAKYGELDRETYKQIISRKTASLFQAGAYMGALLAGADAATRQSLDEYGYNLGLTFQIVDDILDIVGDPDTLGKPVGHDVQQNQGYLAIKNGHNGPAAVAELNPAERLMLKMRSDGALRIAQHEAARLSQRARDALETVPPSPARAELAGLIDLVLDRDR